MNDQVASKTPPSIAMETAIQFTDMERKIIASYRDPSKQMRRAWRLSIQYAVGAAIFVVVAIATKNPWWSVIVYLVFIASMFIRLIHARRLTSIMPLIIDKFEKQIAALRSPNGGS